jgi:uncharacterized membrane protein YidH (DUF202 family)
MKKIRNRVFGNWKSSLVGVILIIVCIALVFLGKASFLEVSTFLLIGLACLGVKDPSSINIRIIVLIFASTAALLSCSPQKRLNKLLKHHPELLQKDTFFFRDTIITKSYALDTVFSAKFDTITINKENTKIQLVKYDSLIYLTLDQQADTIKIEKKIEVDKIIYKTEKKTNIWFWIAIGAISFILFIVGVNIYSFNSLKK